VVAKQNAPWYGVAVDPNDILKPIIAWGPGPDVPPVKPVVVAYPILRRRPQLKSDLNTALLQQQLAFLKLYPAKVDGKFGPLTEKGVKSLQVRLRISVTGIYDQRTATALSAYLTVLRALAPK
jgi:peptidoglycan hydrolase-like protein with peptidoglycan-binding domain